MWDKKGMESDEKTSSKPSVLEWKVKKCSYSGTLKTMSEKRGEMKRREKKTYQPPGQISGRAVWRRGAEHCSELKDNH